MKKVYFKNLFLAILMAFGVNGILKAQDLIITGVVDGPISGQPKALELYALNDIPDLSVYSIGLYSNGSPTPQATKFTFPADALTAGQFISISGNDTIFTSFFGYDAEYISGVINGNGDDGFAIFRNDVVVDRFGAEGVDGSGTSWEYMDGYAYRVNGTGPDPIFVASNWFAIINVFDPVTKNADAALPFPSKSYSPIADEDNTPPSWAPDYPQVSGILDTSMVITAALDEPGLVYYVVVEDGATAPTIEEIKANTASGGADPVAADTLAILVPGIPGIALVTGLTVDVTYNIYLIAEDDEDTPNVQAAPTMLTATTITPLDILVFEDFESNLGSFTQVSVIGDQTWVQASYNESTYAYISGFASGAQDNEDWLISGAIDLNASTNNILSFISAKNHSGPALQLLISTDFTGTYDAASIASANWKDITDSAQWSGGSWNWVESGIIDLSDYSGTVYLAYKYTSNPTDGAAAYEITDILVAGYLIPGSDATLSDIQVNGSTIPGFDAAKTNYTLELPADATLPVVTFTTSDENASTEITNATDLAGDEAARTTTIVVTAQDGTTKQTYTILFNPLINVATLAEFRAGDASRTYVITGELLLTFQASSRNKKYLQDATGGIEVDDPGKVITTTYAIGDKISNIKAKLGNFNGLKQLLPQEDPGAPASSGNEVAAQVISIADFNNNLETIEGKFMKLEAVTFADAGGTFANGKSYNLSDGTNTAVLRTNIYNLDYIGSTIPTMANVSGVVISYKGTVQIVPRFLADIEAFSSDATLSDLQVNGNTVPEFSAATTTYAITLDAGTTEIPAVTYTLSEANAVPSLTNATNLTGTEAERTATVEVVSQDGSTTVTYSIVFTVYVNSSDATLSDLKVNGTTISGFVATTKDYAVTLPVGTTDLPTITFTAADDKANASLKTNVTNLTGTEEERTASIEVVAEDGTTIITYTIVFTVDNTGIDSFRTSTIQLYPVPASNYLVVKGLGNASTFDIVDITGATIRTVQVYQPEMNISISDLDEGIYFIRTAGKFAKFVKK